VPRARERLRIVELVNLRVVDRDAQRVAVAALELDVIRATLDDGTRARIFRSGHELRLQAIRSMLIQTGEDVQAILPAAEDDNVTRRVPVASATRNAVPVAPGFGLDVAVGRAARCVELDVCIGGKPALQPDRVILRATAAQATVFEVPGTARGVPVRSERRPLEVVTEVFFDERPGRVRGARGVAVRPVSGRRLGAGVLGVGIGVTRALEIGRVRGQACRREEQRAEDAPHAPSLYAPERAEVRE
jgi:hypothetical protein